MLIDFPFPEEATIWEHSRNLYPGGAQVHGAIKKTSNPLDRKSGSLSLTSCPLGAKLIRGHCKQAVHDKKQGKETADPHICESAARKPCMLFFLLWKMRRQWRRFYSTPLGPHFNLCAGGTQVSAFFRPESQWVPGFAFVGTATVINGNGVPLEPHFDGHAISQKNMSQWDIISAIVPTSDPVGPK